jgi:hypothetical protein
MYTTNNHFSTIAYQNIILYVRDKEQFDLYHNHGHYRAHDGRISTIHFSEDRLTKKQRLFSCGVDGDLIEYCLDYQRQNRFGIQTRFNLVEYPVYVHSLVDYVNERNEEYLVCSLSNGRLKFFDRTSKKCHHTVQAIPTSFEQACFSFVLSQCDLSA